MLRCGGALVLFLVSAAAAREPGDSAGPPPPEQPRPVEVVVTARGFEEDPGQTGRAITVVDAARAVEKGGQTLPDALDEEAGIWVQKTNLGGGSPFLRGLTGKQVLVLLDGVRLNNSTFRYGPNQYLNTIDFTLVERLEVLHGPGSVVYGSDAVGGVINVLTWPTEAELREGRLPVAGRALTQFSTASRGVVQHGEYAWRKGDAWWMLGATYMNFDDLRAGRGRSPVGAVDVDGVQPYTGYEGAAVRLSGRYAPPGEDEWRGFFTFTRLLDVPRSDKLIASDYNTTPEEVYLYDPQELQFGYLEWRRAAAGADWRLNLSFNRQAEGRTHRKAGWTKVRYENDEITTAGLLFSWRGGLRRGELVLGLEAYHDWIASSRKEVDDGTGTVTTLPPRFPDGTTYLSGGVFADYRFDLGTAGLAELGLRYSLFRFEGDFGGLSVGPVGPLGRVERFYRDLCWDVSFSRPAGEGAEWYVSVARGFRAPNVDDIAVNGDWSSGNDIPNPDLDPERVVNYELGWKSLVPSRRASLSLYYSRHGDLIARVYVDPGADGVPGTDDDLYQFRNIEEAFIAGAEAACDLELARPGGAGLRFFGTLAYAYGQNLTDDEPVRRIPPLNGTAGLRLEGSRWWGEFFVQWAARQDRLSPGDVADKRIPAGGTPGWATLNLRGGLRVGERLSLNLALLNLGDVRYRYHGSGIDAPGFGAVLCAEYRF